MSKLVPNVVDTARIFRNADFAGKFESNHTCITLVTPFMAFEVCKHEPRARFFSDRKMIAHAGGPWFMRNFKSFFEAQTHRMRALHINVQIHDIEARDLFSYQTCPIVLDFNHNTRRNPIALQLVQKAQLFAIADEVLAREIALIA